MRSFEPWQRAIQYLFNVFANTESRLSLNVLGVSSVREISLGTMGQFYLVRLGILGFFGILFDGGASVSIIRSFQRDE